MCVGVFVCLRARVHTCDALISECLVCVPCACVGYAFVRAYVRALCMCADVGCGVCARTAIKELQGQKEALAASLEEERHKGAQRKAAEEESRKRNDELREGLDEEREKVCVCVCV